jgi:hypothetical protein
MVMSGYFRTIVDDTTGPLFTDQSEVDANAPIMTIRRRHPSLAFFLSASRDNREDLQQLARFQQQVPPTDQLEVLTTAAGGHSSVAWKVHSRAGFAWFAKILAR